MFSDLQADNRKIERIFERFAKDSVWLKKNKKELRSKYNNRWIAVHEEKIVASGKDLSSFNRKLEKSGLNPEECVVSFLSSSDRS